MLNQIDKSSTYIVGVSALQMGIAGTQHTEQRQTGDPRRCIASSAMSIGSQRPRFAPRTAGQRIP